MKLVSVKLPQQLVDAVDAFAAELGERRSAAVRVLLRQALRAACQEGPAESGVPSGSAS